MRGEPPPRIEVSIDPDAEPVDWAALDALMAELVLEDVRRRRAAADGLHLVTDDDTADAAPDVMIDRPAREEGPK
jgi:hypothetical protein